MCVLALALAMLFGEHFVLARIVCAIFYLFLIFACEYFCCFAFLAVQQRQRKNCMPLCIYIYNFVFHDSAMMLLMALGTLTMIWMFWLSACWLANSEVFTFFIYCFCCWRILHAFRISLWIFVVGGRFYFGSAFPFALLSLIDGARKRSLVRAVVVGIGNAKSKTMGLTNQRTRGNRNLFAFSFWNHSQSGV